jgi:ribosomal protein L12E/L44/L45/RPP1/RPP2
MTLVQQEQATRRQLEKLLSAIGRQIESLREELSRAEERERTIGELLRAFPSSAPRAAGRPAKGGQRPTAKAAASSGPAPSGQERQSASDRVTQIRKLLEKGSLGSSAIAAKLGVTPQRVRQIMAEHHDLFEARHEIVDGRQVPVWALKKAASEADKEAAAKPSAKRSPKAKREAAAKPSAKRSPKAKRETPAVGSG